MKLFRDYENWSKDNKLGMYLAITEALNTDGNHIDLKLFTENQNLLDISDIKEFVEANIPGTKYDTDMRTTDTIEGNSGVDYFLSWLNRRTEMKNPSWDESFKHPICKELFRTIVDKCIKPELYENISGNIKILAKFIFWNKVKMLFCDSDICGDFLSKDDKKVIDIVYIPTKKECIEYRVQEKIRRMRAERAQK